MKIAYFSPFPPKQTGIATYSKYLVSELRKLFSVDAFDISNDSASNASTAFANFSPADAIRELNDYDTVVYHLGNNPHFHLEIFGVLRQFNGLVVLHDIVLYYLFAGMGKAGLAKHFLLNYGIERLPEIDHIITDSIDGDILRYRYPEKYPMVASIFPHARRIIVHNRWAENAVRSLGYDRPIHVIPFLSYPLSQVQSVATAELRKRHKISTEDLVIGCFGFIGPTKRMDQVCAALSSLRPKLSFKLLIVGAGDDLRPMIASARLRDRTIQLDFVSDDDFITLLGLTDVVVNLRYPSMGESSATLTQAMTMGKPCIVTNDASFRDLPDNCVVKIDIGDNEVTDLANAITRLASDREGRQSIGKAAKVFTTGNLSPNNIARQYQSIIEAEIKDQARRILMADARDNEAIEAMSHLFRESLVEHLPTHLRQNVLTGASAPPRRFIRLSRDEVRWTYRVILGREPENDAKIEEVMAKTHDLATLRDQMLKSEEYRSRFG